MLLFLPLQLLGLACGYNNIQAVAVLQNNLLRSLGINDLVRMLRNPEKGGKTQKQKMNSAGLFSCSFSTLHELISPNIESMEIFVHAR